jgi:hypothetical protein
MVVNKVESEPKFSDNDPQPDQNGYSSEKDESGENEHPQVSSKNGFEQGFSDQENDEKSDLIRVTDER